MEQQATDIVVSLGPSGRREVRGGPLEPMLGLGLTNRGAAPIRLTAAGIILPDGKTLNIPWTFPFLRYQGLPFDLEPMPRDSDFSRMTFGLVPAAGLAEDLRRQGYGGPTGTIKVRGFVDDDSGNRYVSGETYFDLTTLRIFGFPL